jgi:hypothetical protein
MSGALSYGVRGAQYARTLAAQIGGPEAPVLQLGTIVFTGHEVPSSIPFGGEQRLVTHRLIGGQRVVDALGPDDADITWDGRFRGAQAVTRARALDALRRSGEAVELRWHALAYRVVVADFRAEFERFYEVPYKITCRVVEDLALGAERAGLTDLQALIATDLTDAVGATAGMAADAAVSALAIAQAVLAQQQAQGLRLRSAGPAERAAVAAPIAAQAVALSAHQPAADAAVSGVALSVGDEPASLAATITAAGDAAEDAYGTVRARGSLLRIMSNLGG